MMKTNKENCSHPEDQRDHGYGFGRSSGWKGLGMYEYCIVCCQMLDFSDDTECNTPEEIEHNRKKREALSTCQKKCK